MNLAEKYVVEISHTKSFSEAAKKLYISQPSLSTTIKKHEISLGFTIFDRNCSPVKLTPQGEIYVQFLEETLENEKIMINRINSMQYDRLIVGGSNYLSGILIPQVCGELYRRFPNVDLTFDMSSSGVDKLYQERIDLLIKHSCDEKLFSSVPLFEDRYVIVVRKDFPGVKKLAEYALTREEILSQKECSQHIISDYSLFNNIKFLKLINKKGSLYEHLSTFIESCNYSSCYVYNSGNIINHYNMMLNGCGAMITSEFIIKMNPQRCDELYYFLVDFPVKSRRAMILYKKDRHLSKIAKDFITAAQEICSSDYAFRY